jgi:hypothetical protein
MSIRTSFAVKFGPEIAPIAVLAVYKRSPLHL